MAVFTVQGTSNVPQEAIKLSEEEAYIHQKNFVRDWPRELDVLFLRYGHFMAAGIVSVSSVISWNHFRKSLNLGTKGRILMSIPGTFVPMLITGKVYHEKVTKNVLLMKTQCPLCSQLRYSTVQIFNGVLYPGIIGLFGGMAFAGMYKTYPIPNTNKIKELWPAYMLLIKPGITKFQVLITLNLLSSIILPYFQNKDLAALYSKAYKADENEVLRE